MRRFYYGCPIREFETASVGTILGELALRHEFDLEEQQRNAWRLEIEKLKAWLTGIDGHIYFEFSIPRMGKRIDCVVLSHGVIFAIEFKVGEQSFKSYALDQVMDYALDLKNFHAESHGKTVVPILIATEAPDQKFILESYSDRVYKPICCNG